MDCPIRSEERVSRDAEPEIYTLSLHDALPICTRPRCRGIRRTVWLDARSVYHQINRRSEHINGLPDQIGRAGQQGCRARDLHSFPTRRSSDLYSAALPWNTAHGMARRQERLSSDKSSFRAYQWIARSDRKSGSAGMPSPRSTLFPYTTLFRSVLGRVAVEYGARYGSTPGAFIIR